MVQLFENAHSEQIKAWLTEELGPICDAEPDVLSDYVIALLKHDASEAELAALLNEQLADFLDSKTEPFVAKLVSTLSTKSYLPVDQRPSTSAAIVDVTTPSSSSRKRGAEDEPRRSPPKAPRSSDVGIPTGPRGGAKAAEGANGSGGARDRDVREKRQAGPSTTDRAQSQQPNQLQPRTKELCRDFHQKGWCSRGDSCRWEHSTDAITGGANRGNNGMQTATGPGPAQPMNGPGSHFNGMQGGPSQPMFMGRPPMPAQMAGGFPMFPGPSPGWNGSQSPTPFGGAQSPQGPFQGGPPGFEGPHLAARLGGQRQQPSPQQPYFQQPDGQGGFPGTSAPPMGMGGEGPSRGGFAGRGRGRGGGPPGTFSNRSRSTTTLVIENVPAEYLDLVKINDYFKRFGTITNIQIDQPSAKSLVSYSTPAEAKSAHESPEVIFGNRFVKVYFQKLDEPLDGSSAGGHSAVRPPLPQKQTFGAGQNVYRPPGAAAPPTSSPAPTATPEQIAEREQAMDTQRSAQDKVNTLITEQKQLLVKLGGKTATPEEKKAGMVRLRELEPIIKQATDEVRQAVAAVAALPALPSGSGSGSYPSASSFDPAKKAEQKAKMEKERLDRELEAHSKVGEPGSQTEELKAKLEALKAEAASLGLNNGDAAAGRGGYRGRGAPRGASSFRGATRGRGRGGAAPSMRLDNRSTKLVVSDIPEGKEAQPVKEWLKSFGDVASFDDVEGSSGNSFAVTFKTRQSGEAAVRSTIGGGEVPEVGKVKLVWAPAPVSAPAAAMTVDLQGGGGGGMEMDDGDAGGEEGEGDGEENWKR